MVADTSQINRTHVRFGDPDAVGSDNIDEVKYINNTSTRIADRDARAEKYMEGKSAGYKAVAKTGLFIGNTIDRVSAVFTDEKSAGMMGVISGGIGGALVGGILAIAAIAFIPGGALAAPYLIAGVSALGAARTGYSYYHESQNSGYKRGGANVGERIAQMSGAVEKDVALDPGLTPDEALRATGRDPEKLMADLAALKDQNEHVLLNVSSPPAMNTAPERSFAQEQLERRARSKSQLTTLNPDFVRQ